MWVGFFNIYTNHETENFERMPAPWKQLFSSYYDWKLFKNLMLNSNGKSEKNNIVL